MGAAFHPSTYCCVELSTRAAVFKDAHRAEKQNHFTLHPPTISKCLGGVELVKTNQRRDRLGVNETEYSVFKAK